MSFPIVARFSTRRFGDSDKTDIFLGVMFRDHAHLLKPDTVFEIKEIAGVLTIVEVGPVADPIGWSRDVNSILREQEQRVLCTADEIARSKKNECRA